LLYIKWDCLNLGYLKVVDECSRFLEV